MGRPALPLVVGTRYGRLVVEQCAFVEGDRNLKAFVLCDCGHRRTINASALRSGEARACGCRENKDTYRTHGMRRTTEYTIWCGMKDRCCNPNAKPFKDYGGRGITICDRWRDSFANFYADMGPRPKGLTLNRADNDGPYSPENCRWSSWTEQANNKRSNHRVEFNGQTRTIAEWAAIVGLPQYSIVQRLNKLKWPIERALTP